MEETCVKCFQVKPLGLFCTTTATPSGYIPLCKACDARQRQVLKQLRGLGSVEGAKQYNRIRGERDRLAHPERVKAVNQRWGKTHRPEINARRKQYLIEHPEKVEAHLERGRNGTARYRARKKAAPINDLTTAQWRDIKAAFKGRCAYCGKKSKRLEMDHIEPISKGGSHTASNIVPACRDCNNKKHAGPVPSPVQPMLLTLAPAKKTA